MFLFLLSGFVIEESNILVDNDLWTDVTQMYLPVTNDEQGEVADLNGDKLLDIVFANGGDYSEPGPAEFTRIFVNQGKTEKFKEITNQVFGENKYHARVVKISDINNDKIPNLILGTTFQSQKQTLRENHPATGRVEYIHSS